MSTTANTPVLLPWERAPFNNLTFGKWPRPLRDKRQEYGKLEKKIQNLQAELRSASNGPKWINILDPGTTTYRGKTIKREQVEDAISAETVKLRAEIDLQQQKLRRMKERL